MSPWLVGCRQGFGQASALARSLANADGEQECLNENWFLSLKDIGEK